MVLGRLDGSAAARFRKDRGGNFAVIFGAIASVLLLSAGFGLNTAQLMLTRSNLLNALDAAVTSTARDLTTGRIGERDARATVEAFLLSNGGTGFAAPERITLDSLLVDRATSAVKAEASVVVELAFPMLGMGQTRRVATQSAAVYSDRRIEISMMLDVTGSMAGQKLRDLKAAAKNAVGTLLAAQDASDPRVRIALVPYANAVNAGGLAEATVFVERRAEDRAEAPGMNAPRQAAAGRPDTCATERKGRHQYTDAGPQTAMVNRDLLLGDFATRMRSRACPAAAVMPLTADARKLSAAIDGFVAEGGTGGHIGVQWAWYMLSDKWGGVMRASERPAAADPRKVGKFAILMTDGEFNLSFFDARDAGEVYDGNGKQATRDAAAKLCRAMRDDGIEVFTIGFKLENRAAKQTMAECASPDIGNVRHYFETGTGAELEAAFLEVARNIERLALTR